MSEEGERIKRKKGKMKGEEEMKDEVVVMGCCDGMREKEVEERGMKNGSDLRSLLREGRECVAPVEVELGNAGSKEMWADGGFEIEGERGFEGFEMEGGGKEIDVGFDGLSLHEARKCDQAVGIETESNGNGNGNDNEKEDKERGPDCDAEKNEGGERDEICENNDGPIEMKNSFEISLHEMREDIAKLKLYAENSGDLKEKREEVVLDCNSEKIDGEKWYEICEKEEGENEIENGIERGSTESSELNSENGRSKEKIEDGPAFTFEKQTSEKDVKNEMGKEYAEIVELHIEDKEKSKEKAPDCNSEKQGDEKSNEIWEKKEGEKDMKKQMDREVVNAKVELNTEENGDMNGKLDQGPDCDFEKTDAEKRYEIYKKKNGQGKDGENEKKERLKVKLKYVVSYPQRTGRPDCPHYLKTGFCSYGDKCCFNHPPNIANQVSLKSSNDSEEKTKNEVQLRPEWLEKGRILIKKKLNCEIEKKEGAKVKYTLPYPQRKGRLDCDSYLKTGVCFYASKCLYNHPNQGNDNRYEVEKVNNSTQYLDVPIRPGEINCPFYMKHGSCKYSTNCCYNHPNHFKTKQNPLNYEEYQNNHYIENNDPLNYEELDHFVRKQNPSNYEECQKNRSLEQPNHFITKQEPLNYEEHQNNGNFEENNGCFTYEDSSSNELLPINIKKMVLPNYEGDIPLNIKAMLLPPQRLNDIEQVSVSISSSETFEGYLMNSSTSKSDSNLSKKSKSNPTEKSKSTRKSKSNSSYQIEGPFEFPERPGKEECAFYMKCGDCMFKSSCKFHHPKDWHLRKDYVSSRNGMKKTRLYDAIETQERLIGVHQKGWKEHRFPSEAYNEENWKNGKMKQKKREEYPERPDKTLCEYYMKHRDCKFKFTCKFHHPKDPYQKGWN